jgi:hypothetical protein
MSKYPIDNTVMSDLGFFWFKHSMNPDFCCKTYNEVFKSELKVQLYKKKSSLTRVEMVFGGDFQIFLCLFNLKRRKLFIF